MRKGCREGWRKEVRRSEGELKATHTCCGEHFKVNRNHASPYRLSAHARCFLMDRLKPPLDVPGAPTTLITLPVLSSLFPSPSHTRDMGQVRQRQESSPEQK